MSDVHYIFKDDVTYAVHQGKVIAASTDPDEVQRQVKHAFGPEMGGGLSATPPGGGEPMGGMDPMGGGAPMGHGGDPMGGDTCPECGAPIDPMTGEFCPECGAPAQSGMGDPMGAALPGGPSEMPPPPHDLGMGAGGGRGSPMMAKVTTPNGLKGTVLGKTASLWGDEVTIRLENGRIIHLPVNTPLKAEKQASTPKPNPVEHLEARLAATPEGTRESLVARDRELYQVRTAAATLIREGVSLADASRLDRIVVTADVERAEVRDAVTHLNDVEAIAAPGFSMQAAARTTGPSHEDASWLDAVLDNLVKEAEATDFTKLMDEGPEAFTAELPDVALADTGVTRQMASSFIAEKTAGVERTIAEPYMTTFLARVEECRTSELTSRKQTTHKEAAATEDKFKDLPDDALFL